MSDALARVIATALEAAREMDEERIRALIREELAKWKPATQEHGWMSPPAAAKARGISVKRVRALIAAGAVQARAKVPGSDKLEINLASLDATLSGESPKAAPVVDAQSWAAARAARKATP